MAAHTNKRYPGQTHSGKTVSFRSMYERDIQILNPNLEYEPLSLPYELKPKTYTPDWRIAGTNIIVESKGILDTADRQKMVLVASQHPELDFRFLFQKGSMRLSPKSQTTYSQWAYRYGFVSATGVEIPEEWYTLSKAELMEIASKDPAFNQHFKGADGNDRWDRMF